MDSGYDLTVHAKNNYSAWYLSIKHLKVAYKTYNFALWLQHF